MWFLHLLWQNLWTGNNYGKQGMSAFVFLVLIGNLYIDHYLYFQVKNK